MANALIIIGAVLFVFGMIYRRELKKCKKPGADTGVQLESTRTATGGQCA